MLGSYEGAMVDAAAETAMPPVGCRTLCQYPGCGRLIVAVRSDGIATWVHDKPGPCHRATPVEQPEPTRGEQLADSVTEPYERHRSRLRRVNAYDVERMAHRLGDAAQDRLRYTFHPGQDSEKYERAFAAYYRRLHAVRRLAEALERQAGGGSR